MRRPYHPELEISEVADGETVHSRMMMLDHGRGRHSVADAAVRKYMRATDAVAAARRSMAAAAGHRPMPVADALALSGSVRVNDTALDLAIAMRDEAFESLCCRSARAYIDGPAVVPPLNQLPPTHQRPPPPDSSNGDSCIDLEEAQRRRDQAYAERNRLGDQRWRTAGITDPAEADRIMRQAAQWRHGA
jgi:hypothetical protein